SVTEEWANATLVGWAARDVLALLAPGLALDSAAFPHMTMRAADIGGIPARIFRVSFSGELSYEINVPADQGLELWERLIAVGEPFGITPYGTEAMHGMRAEKGYIVRRQETDCSVTSSYFGARIGRGFAIGLVQNGRTRHGERVWAPLPDRVIAARICPPVFYDPEGARRDG